MDRLTTLCMVLDHLVLDEMIINMIRIIIVTKIIMHLPIHTGSYTPPSGQDSFTLFDIVGRLCCQI
jgi:hypothetical protein